jgi:Skp family chaperone for outer membrane proteins
MRAKKIGYFLSILLLSTAFLFTVDALPDTIVTFRGVGVTVNLTFPEEASPLDNIFHNLTITAYNYVNSLNVTLLIYAPIDSTWQIIDPPHNILWLFPLNVNQSLPTVEINFTLPQNAKGSLKCMLYVQTNQTTDYSSYMFYTTLVSEPTFSEMQTLYEEMLANYTSLQANYTTLLNDYNALMANYSSLFVNYTTILSLYYETLANYTALQANYTTLFNDHSSLLANYTDLFANYATLLSEHNQLIADYTKLQTDYTSLSNSYTQRENEYTNDYDALNAKYTSQLSLSNALQSEYNLLNSTFYNVQGNYTNLRSVYDALNSTYNGLVNEFASLQNRADTALNNDRIVMFIFVIALVALIAFIIYLKQGKEEPYVVIRKETVNMKQDEKT